MKTMYNNRNVYKKQIEKGNMSKKMLKVRKQWLTDPSRAHTTRQDDDEDEVDLRNFVGNAKDIIDEDNEDIDDPYDFVEDDAGDEIAGKQWQEAQSKVLGTNQVSNQ